MEENMQSDDETFDLPHRFLRSIERDDFDRFQSMLSRIDNVNYLDSAIILWDGEWDQPPLWSPLHAAAYKGNVRMIRMLLLKGADINASIEDNGDRVEWPPLFYACFQRQYDAARVLLEAGAATTVTNDDFERTLLHAACDDLRFDIVHLLVTEFDEDIGALDGMERTPFFNVVANPLPFLNLKQNILEFLLQKGADVNARDENNCTPLHALLHRFHYTDVHRETMRLLIENGAEVNARDGEDNTPLHVLLDQGGRRFTHFHREIMNLLIESGADIFAVANDGAVPFHDACRVMEFNAVYSMVRNRPNLREDYNMKF